MSTAPIEHDTPTIEVRAPGGLLRITEGQTTFTRQQLLILEATGIAVRGPDAVTPAGLRYFLHMCRTSGFDPFCGDATVMRTLGGHVAVVKLQGMLKQAWGTGEYRGFTDPEWFDEDGTFYTVWPSGKGRPFGARISVKRAGWDPITAVVYTSEVEVYERPVVRKVRGAGAGGRGRRSAVVQQYGEPQLTERWRDTGSVRSMSAKCARAAALRLAWPEIFGGWYVPEEMGRARREQREAADRAARERIVNTYGKDERRDSKATPTLTVPSGETPMDAAARLRRTAQEGHDAPDPAAGDDATAAANPVPDLPSTPDGRAACLRLEIAEIADILGVPCEVATSRLPGQIDDLDDLTLLRFVAPLRSAVAGRLRRLGREDEAKAYEQFGPEVVAHPDLLFGRLALA